jgi:hypothetical protein
MKYNNNVKDKIIGKFVKINFVTTISNLKEAEFERLSNVFLLYCSGFIHTFLIQNSPILLKKIVIFC